MPEGEKIKVSCDGGGEPVASTETLLNHRCGAGGYADGSGSALPRAYRSVAVSLDVAVWMVGFG